MRARALALIGCLAWIACSANDDVPAPAISGVQPDHAASGTSVTVSGSNLCQAPVTQGSDPDPLACAHVGTVLFDTTPGVVTSYTDSLVLVDVPARAPGSASIVVTVAGRSSNRIGFVVE